MKTYCKYLCLLVVLFFTTVASAQRSVKSPCWNITLKYEGKADTVTTKVKGSLYDLRGQAIMFTTIHLGPYTAVTDEKGNFSFAKVMAGTYEVHSQNYCSSLKKKIEIKKGRTLRMDICVTIEEPHLPGLDIPKRK